MTLQHDESDKMMDYDENLDDIASLEDSDAEPPKKAVDPAAFPSPLFQLILDYSKETLYATIPQGLNIKKGAKVLVPTRYGNDVADFLGQVKTPLNAYPSDVVEVIRAIDSRDRRIIEENKKKEKNAGLIFQEKVRSNNLDMKFIACHFLFDMPKVLFFFTASERIDFRKLVKDLVSVFKIRVELRQIGVRDESRMLGGLGCCGRTYCCHSVTDKLKPVSIKMAKEQNLSLNSTKISGQCGRLLCCLAHEYDWYAKVRKTLPPEDIKFPYDDTVFKIIEVNPLTQMISLLGEDGRVLSIPSKRVVNTKGRWQIR